MKESNYINTLCEKGMSRQILLKSVILTDEIFENILNTTLNEIEIIYLSMNTTLKRNHIEHLFTYNIDNVNIHLLRNKHCPLERISHFLKFNDKIYNIAIAHNETINKTNIKKLVEFNDPDVTLSLKFNNLI